MNRQDGLVLAGLLVVLFATKLPALFLPLYWDEIYIGEMAHFALLSHFNPVTLIRDYPDVGHPPAFAWMIALGWLALGLAPWWAHTVALLWSWAALAGTYGLGRWLGGRSAGALAAFLLLFDQNFWALSVQAHLDNALTGGTILLIWLAISGNWVLYAIVGTLVALSKIYGVQTLIAPALIALWRWISLRRLGSAREIICLMLPILAFAGWIAFHRQVTGWGLFRPTDTPAAGLHLQLILAEIGRNIQQIFFMPQRVGLTCAALAGLIITFGRPLPMEEPDRAPFPRWRWTVHAALGLTAFIFIVLIGVGLLSKGFTPQRRYMLPVYPALYLWGALGLWRFLGKRAWAAGVLIAAVSITSYWTPEGPPQGESSLNYVDSIAVRRACYDFIAAHDPAPQSVLTSEYPNSKEWDVPYGGYGKTLQTVGIDELLRQDRLLFNFRFLCDIHYPGQPVTYMPDLARVLRIPEAFSVYRGNWSGRVFGRMPESRTEADFVFHEMESIQPEWRYLDRYNKGRVGVWEAELGGSSAIPLVDVRFTAMHKPLGMHWYLDGVEIPFDGDLDYGDVLQPAAWNVASGRLLLAVPAGGTPGPPAGTLAGTFVTVK